MDISWEDLTNEQLKEFKKKFYSKSIKNGKLGVFYRILPYKLREIAVYLLSKYDIHIRKDIKYPGTDIFEFGSLSMWWSQTFHMATYYNNTKFIYDFNKVFLLKNLARSADTTGTSSVSTSCTRTAI